MGFGAICTGAPACTHYKRRPRGISAISLEVRIFVLVLVAYDVNTSTPAGAGRLRRIAKECVNYGQRVQNSVFECSLDAAQYKAFQAKLLKIIDLQNDSLRFYNLGNNYKNKIEHFGCKTSYDPEDTLII